MREADILITIICIGVFWYIVTMDIGDDL